jgi:hypothetical protein
VPVAGGSVGVPAVPVGLGAGVPVQATTRTSINEARIGSQCRVLRLMGFVPPLLRRQTGSPRRPRLRRDA